MKKFFLLTFATACIALSCSKDEEISDLNGTTWTYSKESAKFEEIIFSSNSKYTLTKWVSEEGFFEGAYIFSDNKVTIYFSDTIEIAGIVDGNNMVFNYGEEKVFVKK